MPVGSYTPISGTYQSVTIGGYTYPCKKFDWDSTSGHIAVPTPASMPFTDIRAGARLLSFTAFGTASQTFNPFSGIGNPAYLQSYQSLVVVGFNPPGTVNPTMSTGRVLISRWDYIGEADGMLEWIMTGYGDWQFQNMGNTYS